MEGGKPRTIGRNSGAEKKSGDARLHFFRGFVGEGDGENIFRGNAFGDEVCHAESDRARFSGAGAGENKERAFGDFGGEALFGIELFGREGIASVQEK